MSFAKFSQIMYNDIVNQSKYLICKILEERIEGYDTLHDLLVKLFNEIMKYWGKGNQYGGVRDISNNDMHIIEAIGLMKLAEHVFGSKGFVC